MAATVAASFDAGHSDMVSMMLSDARMEENKSATSAKLGEMMRSLLRALQKK